MDWAPKRVLITGGASCITSHLADVRAHIDAGAVKFHLRGLLDQGTTPSAAAVMDVGLHVAANHGSGE